MPVPDRSESSLAQRLGPALALALGLLLSACAQLRPPPEIRELRVEVPVPVPTPVEVPVVTPADAAAQDLLAYHERLLKLGPAELGQEVASRDEPALTPAAATRLALALFVTHGNGDLARAQFLLEQVQRANTPEAQAWHGLARLLGARAAEQRRLEEQMDKLNQQARDGQRRLDQLNDKLEALKAIERSLTTRPPGAGGKAP